MSGSSSDAQPEELLSLPPTPVARSGSASECGSTPRGLEMADVIVDVEVEASAMPAGFRRQNSLVADAVRDVAQQVNPLEVTKQYQLTEVITDGKPLGPEEFDETTSNLTLAIPVFSYDEQHLSPEELRECNRSVRLMAEVLRCFGNTLAKSIYQHRKGQRDQVATVCDASDVALGFANHQFEVTCKVTLTIFIVTTVTSAFSRTSPLYVYRYHHISNGRKDKARRKYVECLCKAKPMQPTRLIPHGMCWMVVFPAR